MKRRLFISSILSVLMFSFHLRSKSDQVTKVVSNINRTGLFYDPVLLSHHIAPDHPETPDRLKFAVQALEQTDFYQNLVKIGFKTNDIEYWINSQHTKAHIAAIKNTLPTAHEVAKTTVGACLAAVDQVATGKLKNVFCLTRPPGHHALNTGREEGFCYYNTVAIAARYAQQQYSFKRILIVDWDYHHGNATEAMFYDDPSVLFFSTHDFYAYPGTGDPNRTGQGAGIGYNINIHLPCGTEDNQFLKAYKETLLPAAKQFKPDMIFISAGFDSKKDDLLGCFNVTDAAYIEITEMLMELAEEYCNGRIVSLLEGGYTLQGTAKAIVAHIKTLLHYQT